MRGSKFFLKSLELTESQIETSILHFLVHSLRLFAWKNTTGGFYDARIKRFKKHLNPYALNGAPDIICIFKGLFIGFEVKSKTGRQSTNQKRFEERLKASGAYYFVVRSAKEAEDAMKSILAEIEDNSEV